MASNSPPYVIPQKAYGMIPICPLCRGEIYWSSYRILTPGENDTGPALCANSPRATRYFKVGSPLHMCKWEGTFVREDEDTITIYSKDGRKVPYRIIKYG